VPHRDHDGVLHGQPHAVLEEMLRGKKGSERSKPGHGDSRERKKSSRGSEEASPRFPDRGDGRRDSRRENDSLKRQLCSPLLGVSTSSDEDLDNDLRQGIDNIMKLRDEYDKLEGALKKLGVDPECVVTEEDDEEDGYNAESDLEEELERDTEREVATFVPSVYSLPCAQTSSRQQPVTSRLLDRVDEDVDSLSLICSATTSMEGETRAAHSCPSSPTETECSSGFSTLRRRSVNVTEKVRQNKDGSKIQVVRESAVSTSSANQPNQSVTFQQNSFVYINGSPEPGGLGTGSAQLPEETFQCGGETEAFAPAFPPPTTSYTSLVPTSSATESSGLFGSGVSMGLGAGDPRVSHTPTTHQAAAFRGHIVRLNSIEPNTVMFSTKDYPLLSDVSVPEIIDELEQQFDSKLCEVQGVRLAGSKIFICLSQRDCLTHLAQYGFYVRGVHVSVLDISNDSVVVCLIGVPHYITDSTITMLVGTFGICIGEVERRFYKGVDTGERYVRLKPKGSTQIPDYVTVGGCKILIRVLTQEEVSQPFTLQSSTSRTEPDPDGISVRSPPLGSSHTLPHATYRAKPGHCNGSLTSPITDLPPPLPPLTLPSALSPPNRSGANSAGSSISLPSSPKIARSFRSRISVTLRSPPNPEDTASSTYVPGESVDLPTISPPAYRTPGNGSVGLPNGASSSGLEGLSTTVCPTFSSTDERDSTGTLKKSTRDSPSASSLRKYALQNNNLHKTDSLNSLGRSTGEGGPPSKDANGSMKRASVVFEEPKGGNFQGSSPALVLAQNRQVSTSKTVNGILRKGSLRGDEEKKEEKRKARKSAEGHRHKSERSHSSSSKSSRLRGSKLDSVTESGDDPDNGSEKRSSRSRSNSTKSTKSEKKDANNIALTRDLPWCGCWGNGCL